MYNIKYKLNQANINREELFSIRGGLVKSEKIQSEKYIQEDLGEPIII